MMFETSDVLECTNEEMKAEGDGMVKRGVEDGEEDGVVNGVIDRVRNGLEDEMMDGVEEIWMKKEVVERGVEDEVVDVESI